LKLCRELSNKLIAAESLDGLACIAVAKGEAERAARMFGAARTLHETVGYQQPADESALREPYLTDARTQLDEAAWEAAFTEGGTMTFEEIVEYALVEGEPTIPSSPMQEESPPGKLPSALTRREKEVASLAAQGLTNRQIAVQLSISEHTVANHIAKILRKLQLSSRTQIAARGSAIRSREDGIEQSQP
jgi:DNA-binding CsgD family transcriptional regulator